MNKADRAVQLQTLMAIANLSAEMTGRWDKEVRTLKSELPKREPMNLTPEEVNMLYELTGKDKKKYIKELRIKYA